MSIKYLDFDLLIERSRERYRARVLESPAGEASIEFAIPFTQTEIDDFFIQIGQTRSFETQQIRKIHQFGQSLFEAVFAGQVRDRLRASLGEANLQSAGLRIRLRLSDTPELGNLPWEFIYDPGLNRFLALSVETPVVRYLETTQLAQPLAVQPPLRILAMICGPRDFPRLDVEREWENLQVSLKSLQDRRLVDLQRLSPPTLPALQQRLRREQYHIFHFVGHGTFSKSDQDGYLLLENDQHRGHRLSGRDLGTILHDHRTLRLAVLNACEGARGAQDDQFAGTAQSLVQQGIPAVIAMQFRITDQASITLAHEFYGALADGYPVDAAVTEARKAIKTEGNDLEWGTPVLYMRSPDGHIFDIAQLPGRIGPDILVTGIDPENAARVERLYTEGLEAFYLGQWDTAYRKFQATIDSDPDHKDAAAKLETARQKMRNQTLNEQALASEKAGDWEKALEVLTQLSADDPTFPEISTRIANARRQARLAGLYSEARRLAQAEKWKAVQGIFKEMSRIDPRHPDPDGLQSRAEQSLAKARRDAELESSYSSALRALDSGDWNLAIRQLRRVRQLQPGYRETTQLLHRAESELDRIRVEKSRSVINRITASRTPIRSLALGWQAASRFEGIILGFFGIAALAKLLAQLTGNLIDSIIRFNLPGAITILYHMIPGGLFSGLAFWWFLSNALGRLDRRQIIGILATCTLGQTAIHEIAFLFRLESKIENWYWLWALFGLMIGTQVALVARQKLGALKWKRITWIVASWILGYALAILIANVLRGDLSRAFGQYPGLVTVIMVEQSIASFLGGLITLAVLEIDGTRHISWKTVVAGAVGFYLGNPFFTYLFGWRFFSRWWLVHSLIQGFVAGTSLAVPSRKILRFLVLGLTVAFGMILGQFIVSATGVTGEFQPLILGAFVGLSLGILTRRAGATLACSLVGIFAFLVRMAMTGYLAAFYVSQPLLLASVRALPFAVAGGILALGWSVLTAEENQSAAK